jgi:hypothetical protein
VCAGFSADRWRGVADLRLPQRRRRACRGDCAQSQLPSLPPALLPATSGEERAADRARARLKAEDGLTRQGSALIVKLHISAERGVRVRCRETGVLSGRPRMSLRIFRPSAGLGNDRAVPPAPNYATPVRRRSEVQPESCAAVCRCATILYATFGLPTFVRYFDRRNVASETRPRDNVFCPWRV